MMLQGILLEIKTIQSTKYGMIKSLSYRIWLYLVVTDVVVAADIGLYKEQRAVTAITRLLRVTTKRDCEVRITASENVLSPPGIIRDCESERFAGWERACRSTREGVRWSTNTR
jgi:hypothetical protein